MPRKIDAWIIPTFLSLVALQVVLLVAQRAGWGLPDRMIAIARLVAAILILFVIAAWMIRERSARREGE